VNHTHDDATHLTTGCQACIERVKTERWASAPEVVVHWQAIVPSHVMRNPSGGEVRWSFTTTERVPSDVTADELEQMEIRCDIGAAFFEAMPPWITEAQAIDVAGTAFCDVRKIERPPPVVIAGDMFPLFGVA